MTKRERGAVVGRKRKALGRGRRLIRDGRFYEGRMEREEEGSAEREAEKRIRHSRVSLRLRRQEGRRGEAL